MTIQELFENAQLDALGLLDDREREEFDRAFWAASPGVQAQIRRQQARLCRVEALLPDVTPRPELRETVVAAVVAASSAETPEPAPAFQHPAGPRYVSPLPMNRARAVSPVWRVTAIAMATAAVVLGGAFLRVRSELTRQDSILSSEAAISAIVQNVGARYLSDLLLSPNTTRHVMTAQRESYAGKATVFSNPDWDCVRFFCVNLTPPQNHRLYIVALGEDGTILRQLATIDSPGGLTPIEISKTTLAGLEPTRIAVVSAPLGTPALRGEIVLRVA
ncbi:MAG: hypothetical protein HRU70_04490 [Phycisphaeraceae bacterium]|nr:MAG: hypothetical protein HRU70_04490 [Phycisphaeraceae bacterium]